MIITAITQQKNNKDRYSVFIDDNFAFGLIMQDIVYFKLKQGEEISQIYIQAQDIALHYIAYKMRTEQEVRKKLFEKEYTEYIIERVIHFLIEYHYIDDMKYCKSYIKQRLQYNPKGVYILKMELKQRGIKQSIIDKAIENSDIDELNDAIKLLQKKCLYLDDIDEKNKKRLFAFLQRRGYSYDIIKEAFAYVTKNE